MKRPRYWRRVIEAGTGGPDGWAEFWLECGHGGRILIGQGRSLAEIKTLDCRPCWKEQQQEPARGERHGRVKLTSILVREIRQQYAAGASQAQLARDFQASRSTICLILQRKRWKHVD